MVSSARWGYSSRGKLAMIICATAAVSSGVWNGRVASCSAKP